MKFLSLIRQWFCHHEYRLTKFQALVPGHSYECTKCGSRAYD